MGAAPPAGAGGGVMIEKRKWGGAVSSSSPAFLVSAPPEAWCWLVPAGAPRDHPLTGRSEVVPRPEVSVSDGRCWLLTITLDDSGAPGRARADAVLPVASAGPALVAFVDLDLDLDIDLRRRTAVLRDEADLMRRTRELRYPRWVVRAAWAGLGEVRGRLAGGRWPFDAVPDLVAAALDRLPAAASVT